MLIRLIEKVLGRVFGPHRSWLIFYHLLYRWLARSGFSFCNYGYAPLSADIAAGKHGPEVLQLELYEQVARTLGEAHLKGRRVLEVSCGLGGGFNYLQRYGVGFAVGVDRSVAAILGMTQRYGLKAVQADALRLPFAARSFQTMVSVEAAHRYSRHRFLVESARILEPGGMIGMTDISERTADFEEALRRRFARTGFDVVSYREITRNVLQALETEMPIVESLLDPLPWWLRRFIISGARSDRSEARRALRSGKAIYFMVAAKRTG